MRFPTSSSILFILFTRSCFIDLRSVKTVIESTISVYQPEHQFTTRLFAWEVRNQLVCNVYNDPRSLYRMILISLAPKIAAKRCRRFSFLFLLRMSVQRRHPAAPNRYGRLRVRGS